MAKQTITTLVDDIDGGVADQSISFAYRGTAYSIDLSDKNAAAFDKAVNRFVKHATRESAARAGRRVSSTQAAGRRSDLADVRVWASEQGYEVSSRGRVAAEILEAYDAAH